MYLVTAVFFTVYRKRFTTSSYDVYIYTVYGESGRCDTYSTKLKIFLRNLQITIDKCLIICYNIYIPIR